jgi:hypothetical protein
MIASYAIAFGIMLIVLGFRLKGLAVPTLAQKENL